MLRSFRAIKTKNCRALLLFCFCVTSGTFAQKSAPTQAAPRPAPVNAQVAHLPSSALCALIDCHKPPKPVITGTDPSSTITPGGQMVVIGSNFNSNDGKPGAIVLAIGSKSSVAVARQVLGHVSFSQPYREAHLTVLGWSDGHAYGELPSDITGVMDGPAFIHIVRSDGTASDTFQVQFTAAREMHRMLPASDVITDSCAKNGDENQCNSWGDYTNWYPTDYWSIVGMHDKFLKNEGSPESSSDYYSFQLANGWDWDVHDSNNMAYLGCNTDTLGIQAFDYSPTGGKLKFDWKVNCSILYTFYVFINGPKGVPWK